MLYLVGLLTGLAFGLLFGFIKGMQFGVREKESPLFPIPLLRSMGRREKRKPKSPDENSEWKREQQRAPADPGSV